MSLVRFTRISTPIAPRQPGRAFPINQQDERILRMPGSTRTVPLIIVLGVASIGGAQLPVELTAEQDHQTIKVPLTITGGHETDPRDRGRPVALVAGGLGVSPEVFRSAFSKVKPAPAGTEPDREQVRQNKAVLLSALTPHGVTNEELNRVSDFYRYVPGRGKLWPVKAAAGYARIKDST